MLKLNLTFYIYNMLQINIIYLYYFVIKLILIYLLKNGILKRINLFFHGC